MQTFYQMNGRRFNERAFSSSNAILSRFPLGNASITAYDAICKIYAQIAVVRAMKVLTSNALADIETG